MAHNICRQIIKPIVYIYIVSVLFDYGIYVLLVTSIAAVFLTTKKFKCQI